MIRRAETVVHAVQVHTCYRALLLLPGIALIGFVACNRAPARDTWLPDVATVTPVRALAYGLETASVSTPSAVLITRSRSFRDTALFELDCSQRTAEWRRRLVLILRDKVYGSFRFRVGSEVCTGTGCGSWPVDPARAMEGKLQPPTARWTALRAAHRLHRPCYGCFCLKFVHAPSSVSRVTSGDVAAAAGAFATHTKS